VRESAQLRALFERELEEASFSEKELEEEGSFLEKRIEERCL
jgi:hypothetical protein